jgi:UPF0716 family protein affecting phage T7 exclusion
VLFVIAGFALVYPGAIGDIFGFGGLLLAVLLQVLRRTPAAAAARGG